MKKLILIALFAGLGCFANIKAAVFVRVSEAKFDELIHPSVPVIQTALNPRGLHYYYTFINGYYFKYSQQGPKEFPEGINVIPSIGVTASRQELVN